MATGKQLILGKGRRSHRARNARDLSLGKTPWRLKARTRPGRGGRAPNTTTLSVIPGSDVRVERAQLELSVIEAQLRSRGLLECWLFAITGA